MLTSISPLGERARHNRWSLTVTWYLAASGAMGAAVGAALGELGAMLDLPADVRAASWAAVAALAVVADAGGFGLPTLRRQVNEDWLGRYRGWAYGAGFGAQLGVGVATIVTTGAIYAALAAEVASASMLAGAVIGATFGLARACPILGAVGTSGFADLASRHRRLMALAAPARRATIGIVSACGVALAGAVIGGRL